MPKEPNPPPSGKPRRDTGTGFAGETTGGQRTEPSDSAPQPQEIAGAPTRGEGSTAGPPASQPSQSRQSAQIIGDFEILGKLGQGGMGWVYRARQLSLNRQVALKILPGTLDQDPIYVARFVREARIAGNLHHPNLVKVFTSGEDNGTHYFAMELVEGETLSHWVKRGALPPLDALRITLDVARALEYGWRQAQLIHRDIKPGNIFLSQDGQVKLGDLGLAKTVDGESTTGLTQTGRWMGTPHYISPEQARGDKDIDFRADIYSLGCTLYQMLTGQTPYSGSDPLIVLHHHTHSPPPSILKVMPGLPLPLGRLVARMLKKSKRERFASYEELIAAIESVQAQLDPGLAMAIKVAVAKSAAAEATPAAVGRRSSPPGGKDGPGGQNGRPTKLLAAIATGVLVFGLVGYLLWPKTEPLTTAQRYARDHATELAAKAAAHALTATLTGATKAAPFENTLGMKFVPVPIIGGPTHQERVLFSIWDTRVQDYEGFVKESNREWPKPDFDGPTHPAVMVSWDDAQAFCQWLTTRERSAGKLPPDWSYRLPSDYEWSCAAGMGAREDATKLPKEKNEHIPDEFPWGNEWPPPNNAGNYWSEELRPALAAGNYAWIKGELAGRSDGFATTSPVGSYRANANGLYDMGGNAFQWCDDWFDKKQTVRVLRGASWVKVDRKNLLSSFREKRPPDSRYNDHGFRCVLAPIAGGTRSVVAQTPGGDGEGKMGADGAAPSKATAEPPAIKLWDLPEKLDGFIKDGPGVAWENQAMRLDRRGVRDGRLVFRDLILRASVLMNRDANNLAFFLRQSPEFGKKETDYHIVVRAGKNEIVLFAKTDGTDKWLMTWSLPRTCAPDEWLRVEFRAVGDALTVSADGQELGTVHDTTIPGPGAFQLYAEQKGYFRDIEYVPLDGAPGRP